MFRNYFITAIRILKRNKFFSFINISGLTIGLAACILILLYIQFELSFDRYNRNANRIFRVTENIDRAGASDSLATSPIPLGPALQSDLSGIVSSARLVRMSHFVSAYHDVLVSSGPKKFYEKNMYFTDPSFFKIFTIPVLKGDIKGGLLRPNTIFISSSIAQKYFGENSPIGRTLDIAGEQPYEVTGVFQDFPPDSHIHADFLASFSTLTSSGKTSDWQVPVYTYLLLKNNSDVSIIQKQFPVIEKEYMPFSKNENISFSLMPLLSIHLYSHLRFEPDQQGNIKYMYLFGAIALLILVIACSNYINLATARSSKRALETGVRKVMGASRGQLIKQYFTESFLLSLVAFVLAILLSKLLLPYFSGLTQLDISFKLISSPWILALLGCVLLATSVLSGLYPALLLSAFKPLLALKKNAVPVSGIGLRQGLVIFQFVVSVVLIISAIILQLQMKYVQNSMLGNNHSSIILVRNRDESLNEYPSFKSELLQNSNVLNVTSTQFIPGSFPDRESFGPDDIEGLHEEVLLPIFYWDTNFVNTFGLKIMQGRDFSNKYPSDLQNAILINEAAVKRFGWVNPVGKFIWLKEQNLSDGKLTFSRKRRQVIGVVNNFHYQSLKKIISPVIIRPTDNSLLYIAVRISGQNTAQTLSFIKKTWASFVPGRPLDYTVLQDDYAAMYRPDYLLKNIYKNFTILAIIIACLGLFGLTTFLTERRTKEIGIRKVLGASVRGIVAMLSEEFVILVLIAFVIASPIAWWIMNKWLQNFAYRIHISWWIFAIAGALAVFIALITVSFQAIKAAMANPVESLRTE